MPYVVKISAYLGKDGWPVANLKDAVLFEQKDSSYCNNRIWRNCFRGKGSHHNARKTEYIQQNLPK